MTTFVRTADPDGALPAPLTPDERRRYARQLSLPSVGTTGQERLKRARVLLIGAGGLGSPAALYLAAAGVGTIGLVEHDVVDVSNLHRQLLYDTRDVGRSKLDAAGERLAAVNPEVRVERHDTWLTASNALALIDGYDVVVDGTDNFPTRYLVNDACVLTGTPNVHGSVFQFDGQASVFATADGPCYRCLYPEPPPPHMVPNCAEGGVLGVLPGMVGMIQAIEALKLLLNLGDTLAGRLLMVEALSMRFRSIPIQRDPQCPACGTRTLTTLIDYEAFCGVPGPTVSSREVPEIAPSELRRRLEGGDDMTIIDVREPHETARSHIASATLIPLGALDAAMNSLTGDRELVVVCQSGKRSAEAARRLLAHGFARVRSLAGGMTAWEG